MSPSPAEAFRPGAVGIVGLIEQMFSLTREMSDLHGAMDDTEKLSQENQKLRDPLSPSWSMPSIAATPWRPSAIPMIHRRFRRSARNCRP